MIYNWFILLFQTGSEHGNETEELEQQILALDEYIHTQMTVKQPNPVTNLSGFPDLHVLTQLYDSAGDGVKTGGVCGACKVGIGLLMHMVRNR